MRSFTWPGESVVGRWTSGKKTKIRDSRVLGTRNLAQCSSQAKDRPRVLISASAVGYYGDRGEEAAARGEPFWLRLPRRSVPRMGSCRSARLRCRHSNRADPHRRGPQPLGRGSAENVAAVPDGRGRKPRFRPPVDELDSHPGPGRRRPSHSEDRPAAGARQPGRAEARNQRRVHQDARCRLITANHLPRSRFRRKACLWPDGRRSLAWQPARRTCRNSSPVDTRSSIDLRKALEAMLRK